MPARSEPRKKEGLVALNEDAMLLSPEEHPSLFGCGNLLALTPNPDLNRMLCQRWSELLEGEQILRWEKSGYETSDNRHLLVGTTNLGRVAVEPLDGSRQRTGAAAYPPPGTRTASLTQGDRRDRTKQCGDRRQSQRSAK